MYGSISSMQRYVILLILVIGLMLHDAEGLDAKKKSIGTLYRWKQIDFDYPTEEGRQAAINSGDFIPANVITLGIERWKDRVFVSTPRWKRG
ncbi:Yellow-13, partial [Operophtera brumata]